MEKMKSFITTILACLPIAMQAQSSELTCWTVKGEQFQLSIKGSIAEIPDSVAAVDLRGLGGMTLDRSAANPNCLYYTDDDTDVEGLPNANVVSGGVCDGLLLTDQACFYCPIAFRATDAMLRFTPRRDDGGDATDFSQPCHETLFLPFDADMVIPSDVNGPMPDEWLQVACYYEYNYIYKRLLFSQADAAYLSAHMPYLVRFAYGAYGTQILFCGENTMVRQTQTINVGGGNFYFSGVTTLQQEAPSYFRYYRGRDQYFIHTNDGKPMEPFRCFIAYGNPTEPDYAQPWYSGQILEYSIEDAIESTRIKTVSHHRSPDIYYDLSGRRVSAENTRKGIYIANGRKIIR